MRRSEDPFLIPALDVGPREAVPLNSVTSTAGPAARVWTGSQTGRAALSGANLRPCCENQASPAKGDLQPFVQPTEEAKEGPGAVEI